MYHYYVTTAGTVLRSTATEMQLLSRDDVLAVRSTRRGAEKYANSLGTCENCRKLCVLHGAPVCEDCSDEIQADTASALRRLG